MLKSLRRDWRNIIRVLLLLLIFAFWAMGLPAMIDVSDTIVLAIAVLSGMASIYVAAHVVVALVTDLTKKENKTNE